MNEGPTDNCTNKHTHKNTKKKGVASLAPGQLEFLLQRRLIVDDGRGA